MLRHALAVTALLIASGAMGCNMSADGGGGSHAPQAQPGDMTLDYIAGDNYPSLLVEIDYVQGHAPSEEAIAKMKEIFTARLAKPGGVEVVVDSVIPPEQTKARYEIGDILALEAQHRRNFTGDVANRHQAVIWMVYLDGDSEFDEEGVRALGISYDASSVAIFHRNIERTSAMTVREIVESMVLVHEGGHLFGLVNNGLPMVNSHEDAAHARHDSNRNCVMYHRIETSDVARLTTSPPVDFDYQCRLDMFNAGGLPPGPREPTPGGEPPPAPPPSGPRPRGPILCITTN